MQIHQIAIFLENKPGYLNSICRALADAKINIVTLSIADTQQYGLLRLIVEDWRLAVDALHKAGFLSNVTEVVAVEVADRPGGLSGLLEIIDAAHVNIEYMYAFAFRSGSKAVMVFRFDDPKKAVAALGAKGIKVLGHVELFQNTKA